MTASKVPEAIMWIGRKSDCVHTDGEVFVDCGPHDSLLRLEDVVAWLKDTTCSMPPGCGHESCDTRRKLAAELREGCK